MASSVRNIKLASVDDLFSSEADRQDAKHEKVIEIPMEKISENPDWAAPNLCTKYRVSGGGIVKVSYTAYTML